MFDFSSFISSWFINEFIDPELRSVHYSKFDNAIELLQNLGKLMTKKDIKHAFNLCPIYPGDFDLLGIYVEKTTTFKKCSCKVHQFHAQYLKKSPLLYSGRFLKSLKRTISTILLMILFLLNS